MITELTPEQEALLPVYREKWEKVGTACGPVELEKAKEAVCDAYVAAKQKPPTKFDVVRSPREAVQYMAEKHNKPKDVALNEMAYGSHDAGWLSFYNYFLEVVGLECCRVLEPLMRLSQVCGWFSPYEDFVLFQDRTEEIHLDEQRELHNESGPAFRFSDGYEKYFITGIELPKHVVVAPETQTIEEINKEQNEEVKRIRIERYSWIKYLTEINAQVLDMRTNYVDGTKESLMVSDTMVVLVCADKSTGRIYTLEVPPETKTCEQAQNYLNSGKRIIGAS